MLENSQLGKESKYHSQYDPTLLFAIPRAMKRNEIGINADKPGFYGVDIWNHYEISWLNPKGKPMVAIGEISYPASSTNIIESKSMKLYFNSLNSTSFSDQEALVARVKQDLSQAVMDEVSFKLYTTDSISKIEQFQGICLDNLDISCDTYTPIPDYLECGTDIVSEAVYSDLLKSNCLITGQPDWASIYIEYSGCKIRHDGLLKYIVSYRHHNDFHEQCVECIYSDIMARCKPQKLTVYARYTRRGGLDINPFRTSIANFTPPHNLRLIRQ